MNSNSNQSQAMHSHSSVALIDSKQLMNTSKGWDLRIFRDEQIARKFLCSLCHNVCRDAQELSCTSAHLFCEACISDYFQSTGHKNCPLDREPNVNYQPSRFVARHIFELYVFCPRTKHVCSKLMKYGSQLNNSKNLFCNFQGTLQSLITHVAQQCIFNVISCPFHLIGCPTNQIYRYQLQNHITSSQNKHISLSLQKIQTLQRQLQSKEDTNDRLEQQLQAIKAVSNSKNESVMKLQRDVDRYKTESIRFSAENIQLKDTLKTTQKRLLQFEKAVNILKDNNSKLAQEIDEIHLNTDHLQRSHAFGGSVRHSSQQSYLEEPEVVSQFEQLLALQRSEKNAMMNNNSMNNSILNHMHSMSMSNNNSHSTSTEMLDDKQPNSTDVVCAFLKEHPELVNKLKMSNQIMYANIITDDKYASQFLKKMLESGNVQYRNEISQIVQRLQMS